MGSRKDLTNDQSTAKMNDIDFDKATKALGSLIPNYQTYLRNGSTQGYLYDDFNKTYQIPEKICFTRKSNKYQQGISIFSEKMYVNLENMWIQVYIHYPNQVLRNVFGTQVSWKSILHLDKKNLEIKLY